VKKKRTPVRGDGGTRQALAFACRARKLNVARVPPRCHYYCCCLEVERESYQAAAGRYRDLQSADSVDDSGCWEVRREMMFG
jgi:hypothetical protein